MEEHTKMKYWILWQLLIHATLLVPVVLSSDPTNGTDYEALVDFKLQISSDPFQVLNTWNYSLSYCQWQGVTCSKRHPQKIVALNLRGLGLVGAISPLIGNLSFLQSLNLENNSFYGHIPQQISRLFRLSELRLNNNSIGGEIPLNLTKCSGLKTINLSFNMLTGGIPAELGTLSNLGWLSLASNKLTGTIPSSLGNLSSLTFLSFGRNEFEGQIPGELGRLTALNFLSFSSNNLSGSVPPSIYNLSSLTLLSVAINQFRGSLPRNFGGTLPNLLGLSVAGNRFSGTIPASISNASKLEKLALSDNQFSGVIPLSLAKLTSLRYLNLEKNKLGGGDGEDARFLSSVTNCSHLELLSVSSNTLTGTLPYSVANLSTSLQMLNLGYNQWTGSIPSEISNLINLYVVNMDDNNLTGRIPESIGKLSKLQYLNLGTNRLSGEIPTTIGNLTNMFNFDVHRNNLHGNIPASISNCKQLSEAYFGGCNFKGNLPKQVFEIESIQILSVAGNLFSGPLPVEIGNLYGLRGFQASDNKLSGVISVNLEKCLSLESFYIDGNFFEGAFPPLSSLKGLIRMDISRNNFTGQIPKYLGSFQYLKYMNLSYNDFEGEVPHGGIFENLTADSVIGNQRLCGGSMKLLLAPCKAKANGQVQKRHKFSKVKIVAIAISTITCFIFISSAIILLFRKRKLYKLSFVPHTSENKFLQVSYMDLGRATDGFCSANLIGTGSYGSVYKGTLGPSNMIMAIKVFDLHRQGASKSFISECNALRNVRHRNIIRVISACSSIDSKGDDFKALVFEYMENGNLEQWLYPYENEQQTSRNLSLIQRLNIAIDVATALDYLHNCWKKPIVHCDLKPSNVLLDGQMIAHVGDFGLTKFLVEACTNYSSSHTTSSNVRGTIGYVPPEYGLGAEVSTYGDIYSYGILLLEMFIGKKPSDEIFNESLNLHEFAKQALSNHVIEIIDPHLLSSAEDEGLAEGQKPIEVKYTLEKCLTSIIQIGVTCSAVSVKDRMSIRDVLKEMQVVKDLSHGV